MFPRLSSLFDECFSWILSSWFGFNLVDLHHWPLGIVSSFCSYFCKALSHLALLGQSLVSTVSNHMSLSHQTHQGSSTSYLVAQQGWFLHQAQWISQQQRCSNNFPLFYKHWRPKLLLLGGMVQIFSTLSSFILCETSNVKYCWGLFWFATSFYLKPIPIYLSLNIF